uniref:Uncharacterized protein n=1 Tax=Panagrolaimus sp. ES5 TaxID=591445 RepID=A0AC34FFG3_9BILA
MGRERSRSPSRDTSRHRKSKRSHRDPSPDRNNDSRHSRKTAAEQGIDAAKARLREKLSTAITDLRDPKYTASSTETIDHHRMQTLNLSAAEAIKRQDAINDIESSGFTPASFSSTRKGHAQNLSKPSSALSDHEKAMFGADWQSKALQKNLNIEEKKQDDDGDVIEIPVEPSFSLAHPRFSEDPQIRHQRWLQLFKERRKELLTS